MERREFYENCEKIADFHMPRWEELPEIDLYMDQVIAIAEKYLRPITAEGDNLLTQAMINNYVKNGIVPPPIKKRYGREHMARPVFCSGTEKYAHSRYDNRAAVNRHRASYLARAFFHSEASQCLSDDILSAVCHKYACRRSCFHDSLQENGVFRWAYQPAYKHLRRAECRFHRRSLLGKDACALHIYDMDSNALQDNHSDKCARLGE